MLGNEFHKGFVAAVADDGGLNISPLLTRVPTIRCNALSR